MKKLLAAALACTVLLATGCNDSKPDKTTTTKPTTTLPSSSSSTPITGPTTSPYPRPTTSSTTLYTQVTQPPKYEKHHALTKNIGYWDVEIETKWQGEKLLFILCYPELTLSKNHSYAEAAIVENLNRRIYDFTDEAEQYRINAVQDWMYIENMHRVSTFEITSFLENTDNQTITAGYRKYYYLGGVHGSDTLYYITFDRSIGNQLMLDDIIQSGQGDALYQLLCDTLPSDTNYISDPEPLIQKQYFTDLSKTENWYFAEEGLHFYFNYQLTTHASGPLDVVIPYSELNGILLNQYIK